MTSTENKAVIRRFVERANARDFDALSDVVAASFERHCPATPDVEVRSLEDFRRFLEMDLETFPDSRVTLDTLVAEGDQVAFWAVYSGTQEGQMGPFPPSHLRARVEFSGVFRISGGLIRELRVTWDNVGMLRQLGHFPTDAHA